MGFLRIFCRRVTKQFGPSRVSLPSLRSLRSPSSSPMSMSSSPLSRVWERQLDTLCLFSLHFSSTTTTTSRRHSVSSASSSSQFVSLLAKSMRSAPPRGHTHTHLSSSTWGTPKSNGERPRSTPGVSRDEFRRHADKTPSRISDCRRWRSWKRGRATKRRPTENLPPPPPPPPAVPCLWRPNRWPWRGRWRRPPSWASWNRGTQSSVGKKIQNSYFETCFNFEKVDSKSPC